MSGSPEPILQLDRVTLSYSGSAPVLHEVDLILTKGSFHFINGPSGAGKTSLLRLMSLAERPTAGRILLLGQDTARLDRASLGQLRRRIGVIYQDFRLLSHLDAFDNIALPLRLAGADETATRRQVGELLDWFGLAGIATALPARLSAGQQQLVAVARAVIGRPRLLLADEPTSNIDPSRRDRLMLLLRELNRVGTTILVATHSEALARRWPCPTLHVAQGRLIEPMAA